MEIRYYKRYPQSCLRGRLPTFIENFFALQSAPCKSELAPLCLTIMTRSTVYLKGVFYLQHFFSIKMNDIVKCLGNLTACSLYVDDFCFCYRSKSMATIERQLQQNLNKMKIGQQAMALSFPNQKHNVYISVSCASNLMIQFYIYMDHLFQLLRNLNSLAFYLIENSVLFPILNVSKLNV